MMQKILISAIALLIGCFPCLSAQEVLPAVQILETVKSQTLVVDKYEEVHITSDTTPIEDGTIALNSPDAFLIFDNIRPSVVVEKWLDFISIQGEPARLDVNCRVCVYTHGTAVMPYTSDIRPLTVYTEESYKGDSTNFELHTYHNALGDKFDNKITSLKLKRGYSMVLANNANGTGYSRYFAADKGDLEIELLPALLNDKVSFIRIFPWEWPSKKGWCDAKGTYRGDKMNSTWYYSWGIGQKSTPNQQYVPGKEQKYWPSFSSIEKLKGFSHLYTYTEPDNKVAPDRMMTPDEVIEAWPELLKTGMRIGAPAFMYEKNIFEFMRKADSLEYRVDYVVVHCYWGAKSAARWYTDLKTIHEKTGRPLWIKEWNTGGNWTNEAWPALFKDQLQSQYNQIKGILQVMDTAHFVERYSIYNWVEEKRSMILDVADSTYQKNIDKQQAAIDTTVDATLKNNLITKLNTYKKLYSDVKSYRDENGEFTPAGLYYRDNKPEFAFSRQREVVPTFTYRRPKLNMAATNRDSCQLIWSDFNGEMTERIIIEKKNSSGVFEPIAEYKSLPKGTLSVPYEGGEAPVYYRVRLVAEGSSDYFSDEVSVMNVETTNQVSFGSMSLKNNVSNILQFTPAFGGTPLVLLGTPSYKNGYTIPLTSRVRTAFSYAANVSLEKWSYQSDKQMSKEETLPYLALRTGKFDWNGLKGVAATVTNVNDRWKKVTFATPFDTVPAVFATRISSISETPTTLRIRNVTTTGFEICQLREMKSTQYVSADKIAYVALLPGNGMLEGHLVEVGFTPEAAVGGVTAYAMKMNQNFQSPLAFTATQSYNDTTVFTTRLTTSTSNTLFLVNSRELSASSNRVLNKEQVAYLVIDAKKSPTSLGTVAEQKIRVYPTVTHDYLNIEGVQANQKAQVFNLTGALVKECIINNKIDVSGLRQGCYILKLASGAYRFVKK